MLLQQIVTGLSVGGIYALLATGYSLIYSLLDFSNWAHGEVAMIGAYCAFIVVGTLQLPFGLAIVGGIVGAAVISYLNERVAYRRIRHNRSPNMFLMIAAMGLSTVYQNAAGLIFGSKFVTYPGIQVSSVQLGSVYVGVLDLISLICTAIILVILVYLINKTRFGLNVRAIASNSYSTNLLRTKATHFPDPALLRSTVYPGAAGVMLGLKYNVYPTMGNIGLKAFIASVIGGLGSVPGAIVGAVLLGLIETFASGYINSGLRDLISFTLLIVLLLVRPTGLFGVDVQDKA